MAFNTMNNAYNEQPGISWSTVAAYSLGGIAAAGMLRMAGRSAGNVVQKGKQMSQKVIADAREGWGGKPVDLAKKGPSRKFSSADKRAVLREREAERRSQSYRAAYENNALNGTTIVGWPTPPDGRTLMDVPRMPEGRPVGRSANPAPLRRPISPAGPRRPIGPPNGFPAPAPLPAQRTTPSVQQRLGGFPTPRPSSESVLPGSEIRARLKFREEAIRRDLEAMGGNPTDRAGWERLWNEGGARAASDRMAQIEAKYAHLLDFRGL